MNIYDFLRMQGRLPPAPRLAPLASQLPGAPTGPPRGLSAQGGFMGGVDRLLGGAGMAGLDPANAADARRQGLLAAGAQMMMASQPQFGPPQTLTGILAQGLMAGQQGYGQGMDQGYAAQDMARKQAIYAELQPKPGESIPQTYARVQAMFAAATAQGDTDIARASSEVLKSMAGMMESKAAPKAPDLWVGPDGQAYQRVEPTKDNPFGLVPTGIKRPPVLEGVDRLGEPKPVMLGGKVVMAQWDRVARKYVPVEGAAPVPRQTGHLTEAEAKNAGFYDLASEAADAMLDPVLGQPVSPQGQMMGKVPLFGNALVSDVDQQRRQVAQQFINAILRRESGAAIPDSEYPKYERQYIPVYGDSPDVLLRKARARANAVAGLRRSGGRAFGAESEVSDDFSDVEAAFQ